MIALVLVIIASICNACMDNIGGHWYMSIFNSHRFDEHFWNPELSWKRKYNLPHWVPDALSDAWHIFKMIMIVCLCSAVAIGSRGSLMYNLVDNVLHNATLDLLALIGIYGTVWNLTFSLFYNKILNKKEDKN